MGWEADAPRSCRPSISAAQTCQRPTSRQVPACPASNCTFLQLGWGGREGGTDAWPPPSSLPRPPRDTQANAASTHFPSSPSREPEAAASPPAAARSSSSACRASSRAAFVACSMALAACAWLQSTAAGGHEKGFPPEFSPLTSFTHCIDPLRKRSVFEKGTHILLVPPASPEGRGAPGGRQMLPVPTGHPWAKL